MYAVVQLGSSQYKVSEGDTIEADLLETEEGKSVTFDKVLLYADGADVKIGQPYLKDIKITAKVLGTVLGPKLLSFKHRSRTASAWKKGHREKLTSLSITKISAKE
jgi:large subunit ribosomal protein L21